MEPTGKSSASSLRKSTRKTDTASATGKPSEKPFASPAAVNTAVSSASPVNPNSVVDLPSATLDKPNGKSIASSAAVENPKEKTADSAPSPMIPAAAAAHPANRDEVMLFRDVSLGPHECRFAVSFDSLLGSSQSKHQNPHWTRDTSYRRRGDRYSRFCTFWSGGNI